MNKYRWCKHQIDFRQYGHSNKNGYISRCWDQLSDDEKFGYEPSKFEYVCDTDTCVRPNEEIIDIIKLSRLDMGR
jgi:hypothetical protein